MASSQVFSLTRKKHPWPLAHFEFVDRRSSKQVTTCFSVLYHFLAQFILRNPLHWLQ
jgi:hypothetical protein